MRAPLAALLLAAVACSPAPAPAPDPPAAPAAPAATAGPPPPPALAGALEAERGLLDCLDGRIARVAALLDAGGAFPPPDEPERTCVDRAVARVLEQPALPAEPAAEWSVVFEDLRTCRGQLAFAASSQADTATLSEAATGPAQAEWLRLQLGRCSALLKRAEALLGAPA